MLAPTSSTIDSPRKVGQIAAMAGRSMDGFFDKYIHGTDELPLPALWRRAALVVNFSAPWTAEGGESDPVKRGRARSWSGLAVQAQGAAVGAERAVVRNVLPGSPAARAGLTFGDELIALEGDRVTAGTFARRLADHPPGSRISVSYFRRDQLRQARMTVGLSPERSLHVEPVAEPSREALAVRRGWLGERRASKASAPTRRS